MAELVDAAVFKTEILPRVCEFESRWGHQKRITSKENTMSSAREQMQMIQKELDRIRSEIDKLRIEEATLARLLKTFGASDSSAPVARKRSPSVKPLVLDIMREAGTTGATSADVDALVRAKIPGVGKDTPAAILSRLKSEGALIYRNERYFERQFAPQETQNPFDTGLRAVI
ncbi:MAG: hypothetical protein KKB78_09485 [Alphaproteobacteria bacterium]|nr:hypothetical protein [Alphaproteobacteria bacterium]MBU0866441.1 hypothetical protein [Alphaproteobacteria bacterium]